jgi:hypothetical protein
MAAWPSLSAESLLILCIVRVYRSRDTPRIDRATQGVFVLFRFSFLRHPRTLRRHTALVELPLRLFPAAGDNDGTSKQNGPPSGTSKEIVGVASLHIFLIPGRFMFH